MTADYTPSRPYLVFSVNDQGSFEEAVREYLDNPDATEWLPGPGFVAIVYKASDSTLTNAQIVDGVVRALRTAGFSSDKAAEARIATVLDTTVLDVHHFRTGVRSDLPKGAYYDLFKLIEDIDAELAGHLKMRIAATRNGRHKL